MSPAKKTIKKKPSAKKAPAKKAAPKKVARKEAAAPAPSARRGPAPKSLQKRAAAAAEERKMQKVKGAAGAPGRRAATGAEARGRGAEGRGAAAGAPRGGLGTKYSCFRCGAKFYDLNRPKALCPKCGVDQREAPKQTGKQRQPVAVPKVEPPPEIDREREREREVRRIGPLLDEDDEEIVVEDEPEDLELALEVVEDEEFLEGEEEEPEEES
jgi:uncharacterized protein (TIGR02300 family)